MAHVVHTHGGGGGAESKMDNSDNFSNSLLVFPNFTAKSYHQQTIETRLHCKALVVERFIVRDGEDDAILSSPNLLSPISDASGYKSDMSAAFGVCNMKLLNIFLFTCSQNLIMLL